MARRRVNAAFVAPDRFPATDRIGRVQRGILRAFLASGGKDLTTSELTAWAYAGRRAWSWNVRRAAYRVAVRVDGGQREAIWRLRSRDRS